MKKDIVQKEENEMLPCYGRLQKREDCDLSESCTDHTKITVNLTDNLKDNRLCGLVVRVTGYRSRCPGSIPGATRFSGK
jgi:hypothetical protein